MLEGIFSTRAVPMGMGRVLLGFILGLLLAILGGLLAAFFNAMSGFPWDLAVHKHIVLVGIGLSAGAGAYITWMNPSLRPLLGLGFLLLVLLSSIGGTYIGHVYGPGVDPSDYREQFAIDNTIHLGGAAGGIIMSTALGLIGQVRTTRLSKSRDLDWNLKSNG